MLTVDDVAAVPLFSTLPRQEQERLARTSADLNLSPGEFAVPEGGERALFAVLSGKIEVVKTIDGVERRLGWRMPGTIFGEVPIALGTPFPGGYRAVEPSRVMRVDIQQYYAVAAVSKDISLKVRAVARERIGGLQSITDEPPKPRATIVGNRWDSACSDLRRFLARNQISFNWLTPDAQERKHPETIFLSEAFTRPKVMKFLAKSGFSQSYTYFTWRNTKSELTEYFTELTQTGVREYLRPNLFANTPDILHAYLQRGGRPAFDIRLILAATLGANYGIYSGFELAEHVPLRDGSEEYFDSEKYQIRVRDFDQSGALTALIAGVNEIRREHPALQRDWGLRFHDTDNPNLICYSKRSEDGADLVVVVVNLDSGGMQHGFVKLPLPAWGMASSASFEVVDLLSSERYLWRGESNYVRLDPPGRMGHILHVQLLKPLPEEPSNSY